MVRRLAEISDRAAVKYFIGIDPGKSGGWVVLNRSLEVVGYGLYSDMEEFPLGRMSLRYGDDPNRYNTVVFMEDVHAMPGQGVTSMFTFGDANGFVRGYITALRFEPLKVCPRAWMALVPGLDAARAEYKAKGQKFGKLARKKLIIDWASEKFLGIREVLKIGKFAGLADAAGIAVYAHKTWEDGYR